MDNALRPDSVALSGPMVRIVTSLPSFASLICSASSIAYSSSSLIRPSTEARSKVASPGFSLRSAQVSGTCLTQTTMFMRDADLPDLGCSHPPTACQTSRALCYREPCVFAHTILPIGNFRGPGGPGGAGDPVGRAAPVG